MSYEPMEAHDMELWEAISENNDLRLEVDELRELIETMHSDMREMLGTIDKGSDTWGFCRYFGECLDCAETRMRELGIEA